MEQECIRPDAASQTWPHIRALFLLFLNWVLPLIVTSFHLSQRQLVTGLFEKMTYMKTKFLHYVCHRITRSRAFNANNLYLKGLEQGSPPPSIF